MKVYVVETDNGQEYSDYEDKIEGIFKSYRSASQYLIQKGFIPYTINVDWESKLFFENPKVFGANNQQGWITEFELQD